jgi:phage terminase large subunit
VLIDLAQRDETPTITSIVSESFPHLKRGAILDFLSIMNQQGYFNDKRWNKTDYTYTFETGSKIEFFSVDQPGKVRGPRRERLFINEANNIPYETFDQLEVRTKEFIIMDWNPVSEFWYYDKVANRTDCEHLILTYRDNEALDQRIIESIEQRKDRKGWWLVYGEGQLGEVEGKIYKDWQIIDEVPFNARLERRGLDFGYTNDPTAIVDIYYYDGGYIIDELCYQKGLGNKQIADIIKNAINSQVLVIADSAEPKSIDDIKGYGINILPTEKGKDSVYNGISLVQEQRISITKRSVSVIKEYRNYLFIVDKDGKVTNGPEHEFSHSMDAIRYALTSLIKKPDVKPYKPIAPAPLYYGDKDMPF